MKKSRTENIRSHHVATPARNPAKAQQEADFTAEGSPPPGKVGNERPALPEAGQDAPATADKDGKRL